MAPDDPTAAAKGPAPTDPRAVAYATRVTLVGAVIDGALGVGKILVGQFASSHALVADGVHSLSDLATDIPVLVITRRARAGPDLDHPYGHGRFETLASLALGAVLLLVAGGLAQDSLLRLLDGTLTVPGAAAIIAALASVAAKEWLFRYTRRAAQALDSQLLLANAWHSRSDALSSVAVLVGVLGAMAGFPWFDLAAAIVVALMIGWVGWELIRDAARELVDTGLPEDVLMAVAEAVRSVPGVLGVHHLRSRRMGAAVLVDVDVEVGGTLSVSEGHRIATAVSQQLETQFPAISSVNVHVDPVRGAEAAGSGVDFGSDEHTADEAVSITEQREDAPGELAGETALPLREEAEAALRTALSPKLAEHLPRLTLHYGAHGIEVELYVAAETALDMEADEMLRCLRGEGLSWLTELRIWRPHQPSR